MAEPPASLAAQQQALARHLRDPDSTPAPGGIEPRRLAVYRDLFYNNLQGLLAGNFPVIRRTLGDEHWHALVRAFFAGHPSQTPLFTEIGREFVRWLQDGAHGGHGPAWLPELAHYEWVELALEISDARAPAGVDPAGDLLDGVLLVSPQAWALAYRWPVHRIGPDYRPDAPPGEPTLLLVRRDGDGAVRFAQLSPLAYRLFELMGPGRLRGSECLQALATEAGLDADGRETFIAQGAAMLSRMRAEGSVLGTRTDG